MSVKRIGGGGASPIDAIENAPGTSATSSADFSRAVEGPQETTAPRSAIESAVSDVAREISAGRVDRTEAVDEVIARIVEIKAPEGMRPAALKERIAEAQATLGDDPEFARRVERMLKRAAEAGRVE